MEAHTAILLHRPIWACNRFRLKHTPKRIVRSVMAGTCPQRKLRRLILIGLNCGFCVHSTQELNTRSLESTFLEIYDYITQGTLF